MPPNKGVQFSPYFDNLIMLAIVINCVFLAYGNPLNVDGCTPCSRVPPEEIEAYTDLKTDADRAQFAEDDCVISTFGEAVRLVSSSSSLDSGDIFHRPYCFDQSPQTNYTLPDPRAHQYDTNAYIQYTLFYGDFALTMLFIAEFCVRIYYLGWGYFRESWNLIDFVVVCEGVLSSSACPPIGLIGLSNRSGRHDQGRP